jgi:hypothetical protein
MKHNFQDAFKIAKALGNGAYAWKGTASRMLVAIRPKVNI